MIVKTTDVFSNVNVYKEQSTQVKKPEAVAYKNNRLLPDEVILSSHSADLSNTLRQIRETSDVRQDKVDDLKSKVESGNYFVSAYDIASKIASVYTGSF